MQANPSPANTRRASLENLVALGGRNSSAAILDHESRVTSILMDGDCSRASPVSEGVVQQHIEHLPDAPTRCVGEHPPGDADLQLATREPEQRPPPFHVVGDDVRKVDGTGRVVFRLAISSSFSFFVSER